MKAQTQIIDADKIGSATSPLKLGRSNAIVLSAETPRAGDVVVVRALALPSPVMAENRGKFTFSEPAAADLLGAALSR